MSAEFWYTTILFIIAMIGAIFSVSKLVFKLGKFTEALDNNLDASTQALVYVKGIDRRLIEVEANYVREEEFTRLDKEVFGIMTAHKINHR